MAYVAGIIKFHRALRLLTKAAEKATCNANVLCGKIWGVSGYVFSRYSAIRTESEIYTPVDGS